MSSSSNTFNVTNEEGLNISKRSSVGDILENPLTGEYGIVRVGTAETNGQYIACELRVTPGGKVLGEHYHETIDERVSVISGQFKYILDGQEGIANPGDSLIIPNNTIHDWSNASTTEDVHVIFEI